MKMWLFVRKSSGSLGCSQRNPVCCSRRGEDLGGSMSFLGSPGSDRLGAEWCQDRLRQRQPLARSLSPFPPAPPLSPLSRLPIPFSFPSLFPRPSPSFPLPPSSLPPPLTLSFLPCLWALASGPWGRALPSAEAQYTLGVCPVGEEVGPQGTARSKEEDVSNHRLRQE